MAFLAASVFASETAAFAQHDGPILAAARRETVRRAYRESVESQAAVAQRSGWAVRHPIVVGMLAGTAAGAALSRVDAIGGHNHDPRVALLGTAVGAYGGLIASAVHKAHTGEKVGVGTKIGIAVGAVAAVVLPLLACYGAGGCGGTS
jgi:hypothetical protein